MGTRRQQLIELLRDDYYDARTLARTVEVPINVVLADLEHIQRSLRRSVSLLPAECDECGFVFRKRKRLSTPSRCPECKSERISGPTLRLEDE